MLLTRTATAAKTTSLGRVRAVSKFISLVPFHTTCLMLRNSSGVDPKGL